MYFDSDRLTKDEYEESKRISFRVLYGGIPKEFENIDYFKSVKNYIFELWDIYNGKGYIETPIFKRRFYKINYEEMNPQKLFNYLIQAYETEKNIEVILSIQELLKDKKTKMILYTYDSLLFDISPADGKNIVGEIHKLMDMPTKAKYGKNYGDMKPLKL
jgi:DNA polymerase I-like protein with 3'-5' exonuclease and polymerase domains